MDHPTRIRYRAKNHHIVLGSVGYLISFDKGNNDIKYSTPNCSMCGNKTESAQFYCVSYSTDGGTDDKGYLIDAIPLGYICADHIDEPDFQAKVIAFVSDQLKEIGTSLATMRPKDFTITPSN